jgi:hypothetical protein
MKYKRPKTSELFRSLSIQFLVAGGLVTAIGAYTIGTWVSARIEHGVVQNSGATAALYIESLLPGQISDAVGNVESTINGGVRLALRDAFSSGILSESVVTYNVWGEDGEVLASYRPELIGRQFDPSEGLLTAWSGEVASKFLTLAALGGDPEMILGIPLLEVYAPIRDTQTGEVLAVVEFYQSAEDLASELDNAKQQSWKLVFEIFGLSGALLFVIVHAGSRLIEKQREQAKSQLTESLRARFKTS